jgi:hypothetical protein
LGAYAGTWEHPAYGKMVLRVQRGRLVWEWRGEEAVLEHFQHDTFTLSSELTAEAEVVFSLDEKGAVCRCHIGGPLNVTFTRSKGPG